MLRLTSGIFALVVSFLAATTFDANAQNRGGVLSIALNPEPATLIMAMNLQAPTQTVAGKIYEGLIKFDFDLKPMPGLASSWSISSDGLTYTFKLQPGVKWHDGVAFTSEDVAFTLTKMLPETHPIARSTLSHIESVATPDPTTVIVKLKEPFGAFLTALAVNSAPMMPKHIYQNGDYRNNPANQKPIGTGPFKFQEWKRGEYIRLVRNDQYRIPNKPYLDGIIFKIIPDEAARVAALEKGEIDATSFTDVEFVDVDRLTSNPKLEVTRKGYEFFSPLAWIEINERNQPFADRRFRQALMYAIDRKFIANAIWFGSAKPATGPVASTTVFYAGDPKAYGFDLKKANALLDEMGLAKNSSGTRATVRLLVPAYGSSLTRLGEYLKQTLGKVGIDVTLETLDPGSWAQKVSNWDYEMSINYVFQLGHPAIGVARTYVSSNIRKIMFANTMGYSNPKVDELFARASDAPSDETARKLYADVQQVLIEDVPVAWLIEINFPTIFNKRVQDLIMTAHGINDGLESAYIKQ
ncbi:MAG: ABC transporter substrate-binding protein [Rhizobiales bacterium]|nr:ABC transporter substrate-binding protein [Hyphomicrobiales bacterium]